MELPERDFFAEIEAEQPADDFINELNEDTRPVEEEDFTLDMVNGDGEQPEQTEENVPTEEPEPKRFFSFDEEAKLYVNLLSDSQKVVLPKILEKKIIDEHDRELCDEIDTSKEPMEITKAHERAMKKRDFLNEYKNNVELTEDEKETIRKPLAACLEMWQSSPSPTYALLFAVVTVEFSRALPFFTNDFRK